MNKILKEVHWECGNSSGVFRNRTLNNCYNLLMDLGITQKKWFQFWKPELKIIEIPYKDRV